MDITRTKYSRKAVGWQQRPERWVGGGGIRSPWRGKGGGGTDRPEAVLSIKPRVDILINTVKTN